MREWLLSFERINIVPDLYMLYNGILKQNVYLESSNNFAIKINHIIFTYDISKKYHHHYGLTIPDYLISENLIDENKYIMERLKRA